MGQGLAAGQQLKGPITHGSLELPKLVREKVLKVLQGQMTWEPVSLSNIKEKQLDCKNVNL